MTTMAAEILVRIGADTTGLSSGLDKAKTYTDQFSKSTETSFDGVSKSTTGLSSNFKKLAGVLGVALGAAAVVKFGKDSIAAFEAVEKQEALLENALKSIGQGSSLPLVVEQLKAVSDQTVTLQATTDTLASSVLATGHAYFESLGSKAPAVLAGMTKGLLNIAAATHKSEFALQKMTLSIVNAPEKAIGTLQKLGVITAEDAAQFTALAKAGDLVALRQAEVNAVTKAYSGAAADSATGSEKFAKAMDDLKVKLGAFLVPAVKAATSVAEWASKNTALIATIVGASGLIYAIVKAREVLNSVTDGMGIAAAASLDLGNAFGVMGGSAMLLAIAGAAELGYGLGKLINKITHAAEAQEALNNIQRKQMSATVAPQVDEFQKLSQAWNDGTISATDLAVRVAILNKQYGSNIQASSIMTEHIQFTGTAAQKAAGTFKRAGAISGKALEAWAKDTAESTKSSIMSLGGVDRATKETAQDFLKSMNKMAKVAKQSARAMTQLAHQNWVNEGFRQWLETLGPTAVMNFQKLNHKEQLKAQHDYLATYSDANKAASGIEDITEAAKGVPGSVQTTFSFPGLAGSTSNILDLANAISSVGSSGSSGGGGGKNQSGKGTWTPTIGGRVSAPTSTTDDVPQTFVITSGTLKLDLDKGTARIIDATVEHTDRLARQRRGVAA